ncbi:hypothetical protein [Salipaludibacillus daqingensis]|uniref:hypothetical protein n=1 Tax=Salipaludibacillus daqingensis TaxID=3041001 RepID=UPI0024772C51|nr:hypothetical protein [Salipaludibacillus daqingensis]
MKKSLQFILEMLRLIFILFLILLFYSLINTFIIETAGGFEIFEGTNLLTVFFLLQTGGLLVLMTIFYRNKLQFTGWYKGEHFKPFSKKLTQRLLILSISAIIGSYLILVFRMLTM